MSIGDFNRVREQGPGSAGSLITVGQQVTFKPWLLPQLVPWITENIQTTTTAGSKKVTWDKVHANSRTKELALRRKIRAGLKKGQGSMDALLRLQSPLPEDIGGDFSMFEVYDNSKVLGAGVYKSPNKVIQYTGGFHPTGWHNPPADPLSGVTWNGVGRTGLLSGEYGTATSLGPSAWKRFAPKLYTADMGQTVGEIHQVLPMMRAAAKSFASIWRTFGGLGGSMKYMSKSDADAWLGFQFGWKPFLGDMESLINSFSTVQAKLQQCIRDNGQFIRRRGLMSSTEDNPEVTLLYETHSRTYASWCVIPSSFPEGLSIPYPPGSGYLSESSITSVKTEKTWFSGCFRYWIPSFDGPDKPVAVLQNYLRMYGLRISPLLIWNLTPWSWLVDWCGNVGSNIANYTTAVGDNLTAKYAYIMKETHLRELNTTWVSLAPPYGMQHFQWDRGFIVKTRRHASQFGFSIDVPDFTARQWSILAALGISRLKVISR